MYILAITIKNTFFKYVTSKVYFFVFGSNSCGTGTGTLFKCTYVRLGLCCLNSNDANNFPAFLLKS